MESCDEGRKMSKAGGGIWQLSSFRVGRHDHGSQQGAGGPLILDSLALVPKRLCFGFGNFTGDLVGQAGACLPPALRRARGIWPIIATQPRKSSQKGNSTHHFHYYYLFIQTSPPFSKLYSVCPKKINSITADDLLCLADLVLALCACLSLPVATCLFSRINNHIQVEVIL